MSEVEVIVYPWFLNWCRNHVEYIIPFELAILIAAMVIVILTFIKNKKQRWLASSLFVMIVQLFLNMHVYSNLFHVALRKKSIYEDWYASVRYDEVLSRSKYLVCIVLLLDLAFIVLFCMNFIRHYHIGIIHMIVALLAAIGTRITGYIAWITPPSFALGIFFMPTGDSGVLCVVRPACERPFAERIKFLYTTPKIIGLILVAVLFVSLITLALRAMRRAPKRNLLFIFPTFVMILEIIRYIAISICELFYTRATNLRLGIINIIACILCLSWSLFVLKIPRD